MYYQTQEVCMHFLKLSIIVVLVYDIYSLVNAHYFDIKVI